MAPAPRLSSGSGRGPSKAAPLPSGQSAGRTPRTLPALPRRQMLWLPPARGDGLCVAPGETLVASLRAAAPRPQYCCAHTTTGREPRAQVRPCHRPLLASPQMSVKSPLFCRGCASSRPGRRHSSVALSFPNYCPRLKIAHRVSHQHPFKRKTPSKNPSCGPRRHTYCLFPEFLHREQQPLGRRKGARPLHGAAEVRGSAHGDAGGGPSAAPSPPGPGGTPWRVPYLFHAARSRRRCRSLRRPRSPS